MPVRQYSIARVDLIKSLTAQVCKISIDELEGHCRKRNLVYARHLAMYLCRTQERVPYLKIGIAFSDRDHSTVIKGIENAKRFCAEVPYYRSMLDILRARLWAEQ